VEVITSEPVWEIISWEDNKNDNDNADNTNNTVPLWAMVSGAWRPKGKFSVGGWGEAPSCTLPGVATARRKPVEMAQDVHSRHDKMGSGLEEQLPGV